MRTQILKRLNFHHLHYFWVVAKEGHLTRAAQQLHVSQSALSSQIRQLEDQLGHPLFDRNGRSLRLTEVGNLVLGYAEGIFSLGSELMATVRGGEGQAAQQLRVGAVATRSRSWRTALIAPIRRVSVNYLSEWPISASSSARCHPVPCLLATASSLVCG